MVKVAQMSIPPEYQPLLNKILAWFDSLIYPTWASRYFHTSRAAQKRNKEKTYIPGARAIWNSFTPSQKENWKLARGYTNWSGYNVFLTDYSYRKKNNLQLPGNPYTTHQLHGLKMSNHGGGNDTYCRLHLKDLVGPITIDFYYKKIEWSETFGEPFNLISEGFFFDGGLNIMDEETWEAPGGNCDWTHVVINLGEANKKYFHLILQFSLLDYDAEIFLDNFKITDNTGTFYSDSFIKKSGKEWMYQPFYRKQGWAFYPSYQKPFFEVVYLDG